MARHIVLLTLFTVCSSALINVAVPAHSTTAIAAQLERFNSGDVVFAYPDNWRLIALPPPVVAGITRNNDLSLTISREMLEFPQTFTQPFAQYESDRIRKDYPDATEFTSGAVKHKTLGEILQVDFVRPKGGQPGRGGRPMHLRVYSIPAGRYVYRVVCLARADEFAKRHEPVFQRIMESLVITPPTGAVVNR